jgi:hypothetical protein
MADGGGYVTTSVHDCSGNVQKPSGLQQLNDVAEKSNHIQDDVSNELKGLKSYTVNLNQLLKQAVRQPMKEVEMEVNTI